ncbi:hypothetical protein BH23DEI1_BH23DEI1_13030 [soil metagenome]
MRSSRALFGFVVAVVLSFAAAQQETIVTGALSGSIDGDAFALGTYEGAVEGTRIATAYWNEYLAGSPAVTIIGQSRSSLFSMTPGAIMLDFTLSVPFLSCPCEAVEASLFYSPDGGFGTNVYVDIDVVTARVAEAVEVEPGVFRIVGTFRGTLGLKASMMTPPDPERTVDVVGEFVVERLAEEERE